VPVDLKSTNQNQNPMDLGASWDPEPNGFLWTVANVQIMDYGVHPNSNSVPKWRDSLLCHMSIFPHCYPIAQETQLWQQAAGPT
jgi:hypothetical protein